MRLFLSVLLNASFSCLLLCSENLRDLLCDKPQSVGSLEIKNHPTIHVPGLTRISVSSYAMAMKLLEAGSRARTVGATKMNDQSSRSHSVFTLNITVTMENGAKSSSRLNLVDCQLIQAHSWCVLALTSDIHLFISFFIFVVFFCPPLLSGR